MDLVSLAILEPTGNESLSPRTPDAPSLRAQALPQARDTRGPDVSVSLGLAGLVPADILLVDLPRAVAGTTGVGFRMAMRPGLVGSVRVPIGRIAIVEGELSRLSGHGGHTFTFPEYALTGTPTKFVSDSTFSVDESRETIMVGANVLLRVGTPRVSTFFGGGPTLRRTTGSLDTHLACKPRIPGGCDGRPNVEGHKRGTTVSPGIQLVYGLDVALAPRLAAFAAVRLTSLGGTTFDNGAVAGFGVASGVRVAIRRPAPLQTLPEIRVTGIDGTKRTGRFVSLTSTDVVLRQQGADLRVPLTDVRRVETVAHPVRNGGLLGLVGGGLLGVAIASSYHDDGRGVIPCFLSGIGFGVGLAIGKTVSAATAGGRVLYRAPTGSSGVRIAPIVAPNGVGVGVGMHW